MIRKRLFDHCRLSLKGLTAALLLAFLPALPVRAGDIATIEIHGFSQDGSRFAFEQYGIEDGSGFPYSELFVIDVLTDKWIAPSPIRYREEDIPASPDFDVLLGDTRHVTLQSAADQGLLDGIAPRGKTVGHNPVTELSIDNKRMVVSPRPILPSIDPSLTFTLETFPLADATCSTYGVQTSGFSLSLVIEGQQRILNQDISLPKSRGCALDYHIERVVTYYPRPSAPSEGVFAVLIFMQSLGFEGPDGRYLAITGKI